MVSKYVIPALLVLCTLTSSAQTGFNRSYKLLRSGNITADKNFYITTAVGQSPEVARLLASDETLKSVLLEKRGQLQPQPGVADSVLKVLSWSREDSLKVDRSIRALYQSHTTAFDKLINGHLRPSGYYQRFIALSNADLLMRAWGQYFNGINYIIAQYGFGQKMRYPAIDSASYNVRSAGYQNMMRSAFIVLSEHTDSMTIFYQPSLRVAMELMDINDRAEPAQFEPLEAGENRPAANAAGKTNWSKFPYTAIVVPGAGPDIYNVAISPGGKLRCELAAGRYKKGMAPFIIVSGGNCHPFHTPYNEALEMKKYLMGKFSIPESAIIIEPQARHTTSNFRNATRLMARYGIPMDKAAVCVTTFDQAFYINNKLFDARCMKELGYLPYRDVKRLSTHELAFYPVMDCLHMDPNDPLDP